MKLDEQYRIQRLDSNNLIIQVLVASKKENTSPVWRTISYHGNSAFSLASGLLRLVIANHTPKPANLSDQLETLRLEVVSRMGEIEKMIEKAKKIER